MLPHLEQTRHFSHKKMLQHRDDWQNCSDINMGYTLDLNLIKCIKRPAQLQ